MSGAPPVEPADPETNKEPARGPNASNGKSAEPSSPSSKEPPARERQLDQNREPAAEVCQPAEEVRGKVVYEELFGPPIPEELFDGSSSKWIPRLKAQLRKVVAAETQSALEWFELGRRLNVAEKQMQKNQFVRVCREELKLSYSQVSQLLRVARDRRIQKLVENLSPGKDLPSFAVLYQLSDPRLSDAKFEEAAKNGLQNLTRETAIALRKGNTTPPAPPTRLETWYEHLEGLSEGAPRLLVGLQRAERALLRQKNSDTCLLLKRVNKRIDLEDQREDEWAEYERRRRAEEEAVSPAPEPASSQLIVCAHTGMPVARAEDQNGFVRLLLAEARASVDNVADLDQMWLENESCIQTLSPEASQTLEEEWDKLRSEILERENHGQSN
jgi:hypothetical protein